MEKKILKDNKRPFLNIIENDEMCTLSISAHKENQSEDEIRMINDAIEKLLDFLPDVEEESHVFGDFIEPLLFDAILKSVMERESQNKENQKLKEYDFKIGDRVRFKNWVQMENEYGLDESGGIRTIFSFSELMKHLCGTFATIEEIERGVITLTNFSAQGRTGFFFTKDMVEPSPYYCGKVVCVESKVDAFTVGKNYKVKDGRIKTDEYQFFPPVFFDPIKSLEELNKPTVHFIEVKDE